MQATRLSIPDVILIAPKVFSDERGFFYESYNQQAFIDSTGIDAVFVQDNHSKSQKGVLRGLHYQLQPAAQGKLVRVIAGEIFDVAVDIRKSSKTFGQWVGMALSGDNKLQMWIPAGFAHGFVTLSDTAEVLYKTTDFYRPEDERCIAWDDPQIQIDWHIDSKPSLSAKDKKGLPLRDAEVYS